MHKRIGRAGGWLALAWATACGGGGGGTTESGLSVGTTAMATTTGGSSGGVPTGSGTTDASTGPGSSATTGTTGSSGDTGDTGTGTTGTTGTVGTSGTTGPVDFCDGMGGILLPGDMADACTADLGKKTFLFAVCSCTSLTANNMLRTDSFDSQMMNPVPMDGGSVGVNGMYTSASPVDIGGSLWIDGAMQTFNAHEVAQDLQCGGDISATSPSHVGASVFVEGNINAQNKNVTIDKDLHIPAGKAVTGTTVLGKTFKEPVAVATPCDCADLIDIDAIVQGYQQDNDDLAQAIEPGQLVGVAMETALELPCGRYYFDAIDTNHKLTLTLTGRTVIAVAGDVKTAGAFTIALGPAAELDLFVAGDVTLNNAAAIGDIARPAATRIYVDGAFKFASALTLGANLYQPNATFTASNVAEIWGSIFVGGLDLSSPFVVHYDQAILDLEGCDEGGGCTDCHDCANPTPACKGGSCVPCQLDSDCCPPLVCDQGLCKAILPG